MKNLIQATFILLIINCFLINSTTAQISINTDGATPDTSAMLDVTSTDKGVLIPRMTTAERTAISSPATSLLVYDTDEGTYWYYENSEWKEIATQADVSNLTAIQEPSHISTTAIGNNPIEMVEDNSFLYILERDDDQIRVVNINIPTAPTTATTFLLPNNAYLTDIAIAGNYAYVTSSNPNEPQLWIFDISTPSSIDTIGSFDVGGRFSSVDISGNYAYVTDFINEKLRVLDISTPSAPSQVAEVDNIYNEINVTSPTHEILIEGNYAYIFHSVSSSSRQASLSVVDISTPTSPSVVSTTTLSNNIDEFYSLIKHGNYLYYDSDGGTNVNVIDVSAPATPSFSTFTAGGGGISIYTLALQGDYLFLNGAIGDHIDVKDLSTSATNPSSIYTTSSNNITSGSSTEMIALGSFLYTITETDDLLIHQIAPTYMQGVTTDGSTIFYEVNNSLGDHAASENIQLNDNWLSNDGDDEGISIDDDGNTTVSGQLTIGGVLEFPTVDGTANQVLATDGSGIISWSTVTLDSLTDADGDTKIQVEESSDDDIIRFDLGGTEFMRLDSGRIEILNTGGSVFIGEGAGEHDDYTDNRNIFIGDEAGYNNTEGIYNIFLGSQSGYNNTEGIYNIFLGFESGHSSTTGDRNIFQGFKSGYSNIEGNDNIFQGLQSGYSNTTGDRNIFQGLQSGYSNTTGNGNIFQGYRSGHSNTEGNYNIFLGYRSGHDNQTGEKNIFLGYETGYSETGSNKLYIDNSNTNSPLIYGDFDSDSLQINGTLNINGVYEFPIVDGTVNQVLATDGSGSLTWSDLNNGFLSESGVIHSTNNSDDFIIGADSINYGGNGSGSENKLFFDKSKGAFRAGGVYSQGWDESNLGEYSTAFGKNSKATGNYATAMGNETTASGDYSTAIGYYTEAYADYETAIGLLNTSYTPTNSNTDRLFVIGNGSPVTGNSDAMIVYKSGNTEINGALTINNNYTLPTTDGAASQVLATDGSGTLSWTDQNSIDLTGNIAIGTSSAGAESDFQDGSSATNDGFLTTPWIYTNAIEATGERGASSTAITVGNDGMFGNTAEIHLVTNGVSALTVDDNSCVGIGTTTPTKGLLEVSGSANNLSQNYTYYNYNNNNSGGSLTNNPSYSIYADGRIAGSHFHAHSDKRIKEIQGISNAKEDLNTLMNIEITNYKLIDKIAHGDVPIKKVIAQQVKEVYPQAITSNTVEVVPDIYQTASMNENGWIAFPSSEFQISNTELKVGEKVQILVQNKKELLEVLEIKANTFRVSVEPLNFNDCTDNCTVFVYGRQVDDFHTVDYEAISMLNVSATQQLVKEIEQLKIKNNEQQKEIKQLETQVSKIQQLEQQNAEMKAMLQQIQAQLGNQ